MFWWSTACIPERNLHYILKHLLFPFFLLCTTMRQNDFDHALYLTHQERKTEPGHRSWRFHTRECRAEENEVNSHKKTSSSRSTLDRKLSC